MQTKLPKAARVELSGVDLSDNLVGLIQGIYATMSHVLGDEMPEEFGLDEMLCVSGVAFKNYVYEPEYNKLENPRNFSKLGEFVCNYGAFESLGYYTGWDVKEFNEIGRDDFWKLLQFEIASGRPVVTLGAEATIHPVVVVGYSYEPRLQTLDVIRPGSDAAETVDVTGWQDFQEGEESFTNWMLIARPSEQPEWTSSRNRQRLRALRWTVTHAGRHKEFSQETRENYAPGLRSFESFLGIVERQGDRLADEDEPSLAADAAITRYIAAHIDGLRLARQAASRRLPAWASDFVGDAALEFEERQAVEDALEDAAEAYGQVAKPLAEWQEDWAGGELSTDDLEALWRAYSKAAGAEEDAVVALTTAVKWLPKGF